MLLYTDGLIERRDQTLDDGLQRLQNTVTELTGHHPSDQQPGSPNRAAEDLERLCDQLLARLLPDHPGDDVALLAVRLHPQR